jgi:hypothetical protein
MRGSLQSPESLAQGMFSQRLPVNPGELPVSLRKGVWFTPNAIEPGLRWLRRAAARSEEPPPQK